MEEDGDCFMSYSEDVMKKLSKCLSILIILILIFGQCMSRLNKKSVDMKEQPMKIDMMFDKQWYLQDNFKNVLVGTTSVMEDGFITEAITINSCVDLGIVDFWENNKRCEDKELVIAMIDSCVDIEHELSVLIVKMLHMEPIVQE